LRTTGVISATFQRALSSLTAICVAVMSVLPSAAFGNCCCEAKQPVKAAVCCCQTKAPAKTARACCASKAAKTSDACVSHDSKSGCQCDACHCQAAKEPTPISQPRSDGPRFEAPVAVLAPVAVTAASEVSSAASSSAIPTWLPRPVRERYCVWVI
jgi:hypothetical protein